MRNVVNPFWSKTQQREAVQEAFGPGYDVSALGLQPGSNSSTPQKSSCGTKGKRWCWNGSSRVVPIALSEGKWWKVSPRFVEYVGECQRAKGWKNMGLRKGLMVHRVHMLLRWTSKSLDCPNFMTWLNPERFLSQMCTEPIVPTVFEPFVPKPPPGPPPPSPPRLLVGSVTPPVPLCRSKGKRTWRKNPSNVDHQLCDISKGKWTWRKQLWDGLGWKPRKRWMGSPDLWKSNNFFGTVTLNLVLRLGMSWQKTVVAWRTTVLSPSVVNLLKMLRCCSHCWLLTPTAPRAAFQSGRSPCCHGPY